MKTKRKSRISGRMFGLKAVEGDVPGIYEAIVAVFGNVDHQGDRIIAGAFAKSLDAWKSSGDPIPVIFSHQWDTLESHIGEVLEAKELMPGDSSLPTELRANGGLWTRFQLDLEEGVKSYAPNVDRLLSKRRLKEFSFAYDVLDERRGSDGANELLELDLIETGPTLKGANPATRLLADSLDEPSADLLQIVRAGAKTVAHAFAGGVADDGEDPARCVLCGLTRNTAAHNTSSTDADGEKAWVNLTGSMEETQEAAYEAAFRWAQEGNVGDGGFYSAYLEATFPDRVVVLVEGWSDPVGEGEFYELEYTIGAEGAEVTNPQRVEIQATTVAKARSMKHLARPGGPKTIKSAEAPSPEPDPEADAKDREVLSKLDELILPVSE
jgi:HK97 family phage prohead protease